MFSRLAGFSERAIADWESGKPVSEPGLRRIKELDRFRDRLSEIVASDAIPAWLDTPNEAFDGLKPLEVIERGNRPAVEYDLLILSRESRAEASSPDRPRCAGSLAVGSTEEGGNNGHPRILGV